MANNFKPISDDISIGTKDKPFKTIYMSGNVYIYGTDGNVLRSYDEDGNLHMSLKWDSENKCFYKLYTDGTIKPCCTRPVDIKIPGFLYVCGQNHYGQLGTVTTDPQQYTLIKFPGITKWKTLYCGYAHTLAVTENDEWYGWGYNNSGELGLGYTSTKQSTPIKLNYTTKWKQLCNKAYTVFAQADDGYWYGWGTNNIGQLGVGYSNDYHNEPIKLNHQTKWKQIYNNSTHTLAATENDEWYGWGYNFLDQFGVGSTIQYQFTPILLPYATKWKQIKGHSFYNIAQADDGYWYGWGNNSDGQLGLGHSDTQITPIKISNTKWNDIICGNLVTAAISDTNELYLWGNNNIGQLGLGHSNKQFTPAKLNTITKWTYVTVHEMGASALTDMNVWYGWGRTDVGQLGLGHSNTQMTPIKISDTKWKTIIMGYSGYTIAMI